MLRPATHTDHTVAATVQEAGTYQSSERARQGVTGRFYSIDVNDSVLVVCLAVQPGI
jgi:hypothetical protein